MFVRTAILIVIAKSVISEELRTNETKTVSPEPKNSFKFEDQPTPQSYGLIRFEENNEQKYGFYQNLLNNSQRIKFEENNRVENQRPNHQKKKRRRRRPKQVQNAVVPGYPVTGPVFPGPMYSGQRPYPQPGYPYPGQFYKPRPSPTSAALSAVTEALTSIALYDDRQCVPRLLCEAAGGAGAGAAGGAESTGGGGLLQAVTGLQPLLTLLAAYNGISSSPLFIFGRAVFLGMTSKANPGTCRYAYPDCPNDPEQLVHYLNNHNGGFFRFFAAPELNQQQGLEQFYNQLSGQNYGYYQPQQNLPVGYGQFPQQNYQNPNLQQPGYGQQLQQGFNQNQNLQGHYQNQNLQQVGYGQLQPNYQNSQNFGYQRPNLYGNNNYDFYGNGYPYQQNFNYNRFKSKEIQKRIQNTPNTIFSNSYNGGNTKWLFPEDTQVNNKYSYDNVKLGKVLKFPQNNVNSINAAHGFVFPGIQSNRDYDINNIEADVNDFKFHTSAGVNGLRFENQYNYALNFNGNYFSNDKMIDDGRTLYIVRGNGDPNHPEIVHLASGQSL